MMPTKSQALVAGAIVLITLVSIASIANIGGLAAVALEGNLTTKDADGAVRSVIPLAIGSRLGGPINLALAIFALTIFVRTKKFRELAAMIPGQFGMAVQTLGTTDMQESREFYMELLERSIDKNNKVMIDAAILEIQSLGNHSTAPAPLAEPEPSPTTTRSKK
jgi:hypothetical protein